MNNMFVSNAASSALGAKRIAKSPVVDVHSKASIDIPIESVVAQPRAACKYEKIEKMITHLQDDVRELQDIVKYFTEIIMRFGEKLDNGERTVSDEIHAFDDIENASDGNESDHNISRDASDSDDNEDIDDDEGDCSVRNWRGSLGEVANRYRYGGGGEDDIRDNDDNDDGNENNYFHDDVEEQEIKNL
jgi:hypothetical protein